MTVVRKAWHLLPHDPEAIRRLSAALHVSPVVAQLLHNRGLSEPEPARRFLDTPLGGLHPPELLPGAAAAADRLWAAVQQGRPICVFGDYDVDGITGTAILLQALKLVGAAKVDYFMPHRFETGYGLTPEALRQVAESKASLLVTVDCGIASLDEADAARALGLELIVTDHHEPRDRLPTADVIVHPRLPGSAYPFPQLSGAAVAFKVAWALCQKACGSDKVPPRFREFLLDAVGLAALGIVADVMPLGDENRILVRHGLSRLRQAPSIGLKALMTVAGLNDLDRLRAVDIGYRLAPRLNAAGRLGCARFVVDLLTTTSSDKALELARILEQQNAERQTLERRALREAREQLDGCDWTNTPALVLASPEWHAGIIGIVASRLVDLYARPTLLIAVRQLPLDGAGAAVTVGQGSGRSVPGFPLHEALLACSDLLLSHGGHQAAAGFKVVPEHIDALRTRFCAYTAGRFPDGAPPPRLVIDAEVPLSALTFGLLRELDRLEPYGSGNPRPLFLAGDLQVLGTPRRLGQGERHLSFRVRQHDTSMRAIAFGLGERLEELIADGGRCSLVFTPRVNEWQGYRSVELEVIDFQPGRVARLD